MCRVLHRLLLVVAAVFSTAHLSSAAPDSFLMMTSIKIPNYTAVYGAAYIPGSNTIVFTALSNDPSINLYFPLNGTTR